MPHASSFVYCFGSIFETYCLQDTFRQCVCFSEFSEEIRQEDRGSNSSQGIRQESKEAVKWNRSACWKDVWWRDIFSGTSTNTCFGVSDSYTNVPKPVTIFLFATLSIIRREKGTTEGRINWYKIVLARLCNSSFILLETKMLLFQLVHHVSISEKNWRSKSLALS